MVQLLGNDRGVEHVVSVCNGILFDSNDAYAQTLSYPGLDRAVGAGSQAAIFQGYQELVLLRPHAKLVRAKARIERDAIVKHKFKKTQLLARA